MSEILIIEDEVVLARSIVSFLERRAFSAGYAVDAASARARIERKPPRLVILDYKLDRDDGLDLLRWIRQAAPLSHVVMMTGHGDIDVAVRAMKAGARDFLVKPTPLASIAALAGELMLDEMQGGLDRHGAERILGRSSVANALRATVRKLGRPADRRPGVLIIGPEGSGKQLVARALHETAAPEGALERLDCRIADEHDLDAVFGQVQGGTLLLAHVSQMAGPVQTRLLHLLERTDLPPALIATSERHLMPGADFLPDLLYRIQVGWVDLPPLNARAADVLPIAEFFARRLARDRGEPRPRFTPSARAKLLEHDWPGNVAELENCIERAMLLQSDGEIDAAHVRAIGQAQTGDLPTLHEIEVGAISKALSRTGGNVSRAAEILGISRDTLRYRMEKFALSRR